MASETAAHADWNVVITLPEHTFREARRLLGRWGKVRRTGFHNVLGLAVEEPRRFLADFAAAVGEAPGLCNFVSHVVPVEHAFALHDRADFEARTRDIALGWLPRLAGKSLKVRLHRRGFKAALSSHEQEGLLADAVLAALTTAGTPGSVDLEDPDYVIQIETIGGRAGMSLWSREERQRFSFLGVD